MNRDLYARVWLPGWLYGLMPAVCVLAGMLGLFLGLRTIALLPLVYGLVVLCVRWRAAALWLALLAVPTITPERVLTVRMDTILVPVSVVSVSSRRGSGPVKTTITPARVPGSQRGAPYGP